jgi:hypothetical protein
VAEAVSLRSVTAETLVRFVFSPCEICSAQIGIGKGFLSRVLPFSPRIIPLVPVPVAARSKAKVYGSSPAAIMGSNPTGGMDVCLLCVLCVVR